MNDEPHQEYDSGFKGMLTWALKTTLRLAAAALLLVILAAMIYWVVQQLDRRFKNTNQRIDLLHSDLGNLLENDSEQREQFTDLQIDVEAQVRQSTAAEEDLVRLDDLLATLNTEVITQIASSEIITTNVATLYTGLAAVETDVEDNQDQIGGLGTDFDDLETGMNALASQVDELKNQLTARDEEVVQLQQALTLFRLWELVARARLHLAENNPGLAQSAVEGALLNAGTVKEIASKDPEAVAAMQLRLSLALDALPDDPIAAARDLEGAWEELDRLMVLLVLTESQALTITPTAATLAGTPVAVPTEASPQPTATP